MAEFVQKKIEDMRPVLEQMKKLELFDEHEIRDVTKKLKEHEYKLQRHTKSKEDFLKYIQYLMDLMKLVKQRREKYRITKRKSDLDFTIANKINHLYKEAILKFQDDLRFWIAYMTFCKHVKFHSCISRMIGRMLSVHQDKPKCWHIAARWEIEENKNLQNAKNFLLRGLHFHPESQLLYKDIFKLELDIALGKNEDPETEKEPSSLNKEDDSIEKCTELKKAFIIYEQAFKRIKDIKFIIELLNIVQEYLKADKLQRQIVSDMVKEFPHEPIMWDTMARRELEGLVQPSFDDVSTPMEVDTSEQTSIRDRISNCFEVYQTAVKMVKTEEMWSLFIDCMLEINQKTDALPNFKRKLLKSALLQGHQAKKLKEKYYLNWIDMLRANQNNQEANAQNKLYEVLCWATEALPGSESLWNAHLHHLLVTDQEDLAAKVFKKAVGILGKKSLPLWKLRLLHTQAKSPDKLEQFFQDALGSDSDISNYIKPIYIEWITLTQDIKAARKAYEKLCLIPPPCLELHKKMAALELLQTEISLQNSRKPHEMKTLYFGKDNTDVWMDYITFEMKHGEPSKVPIIYNRAVKTLKPTFADNFITEFSLVKVNPESLGISL